MEVILLEIPIENAWFESGHVDLAKEKNWKWSEEKEM